MTMWLHVQGAGVPLAEEEAFMMMRQAAEDGYVRAMYALALRLYDQVRVHFKHSLCANMCICKCTASWKCDGFAAFRACEGIFHACVHVCMYVCMYTRKHIASRACVRFAAMRKQACDASPRGYKNRFQNQRAR